MDGWLVGWVGDWVGGVAYRPVAWTLGWEEAKAFGGG